MASGSASKRVSADIDWLPRARFARLSLAVKELSTARTHAAIVDATRRAARDLTGALGVAIVLRDGDHCHYIAEDSEVPLWLDQKFPLTECISGWAMLRGEQLAIPDIYADARVPHDAYRPTGINSLIMTPVGEPEAFAALGAYWRDVRQASPDEISSLAALASCMATALQTIELTDSLRAEANHKQLLINELNHRVKNTLAIVQGLAAQTLSGERPTPQVRADFESRLMALASAHILMTEVEWRAVGLRELILRTVKPFSEGLGVSRIALDGADAALAPKSAVAFAMAVHELCVNAAKHGALSTPSGRVDIDWRVEPTPSGPRLRLDWRESGGPVVTPPLRRGFGSRLLERGLSAELNGQVRLHFRPEGLWCEMDAPVPIDDPGLFPLPN